MDRINKLRAKMAEQDVDLIVLGPGFHLSWLLDMRPHADERPLLFCLTADDAGFLMPSLETESARRQTDLPFFEWSDNDGPDSALEQLMDQYNIHNARSIAIDETMRADHASLIQDRLMNTKRQFCDTTVSALRASKDADEYAKLKHNAQIADQAMQAAWAQMRPGMTEAQVAAIVHEYFDNADAKTLFTIVGAGANGALPHHHTGDTILKTGDAVVMDIGASHDGYSSDITRMAIIGEPPEDYEKIHAIVEDAVQAAMAVAKPGVKAHILDDTARKVITDAGYGEYFMHRLGHGMGVQGHEPPYISGSSQAVLEENMVFSIEPGIYLPGKFGIRLEDIVILRADGPEIFSSLNRDVKIVD